MKTAWAQIAGPHFKDMEVLRYPELVNALFDMQPVRAESLEEGMWAFRHKTIHEHFIAAGLLANAPKLALQPRSFVDVQLERIPRKEPGVMRQCMAYFNWDPQGVAVALGAVVNQEGGHAAALAASLLVRNNRLALSCLGSLEGLDLRSADLRGAIIHNTNMNGVNFEGSSLRNVSFSGSTSLKNANFNDIHVDVYPTLYCHKKAVVVVAVSPCGTHFATASADKIVQVWDTKSLLPRQALTLSTTTGPRSLAISCGPKVLIACGSTSGGLVVWDVDSSAECFRNNKLMGNNSVNIAFHPNGQRLAVVGNSLDLFDTEKWTQIKTDKCHSGRITAVAYYPSGTHIVTQYNDEKMRVKDADTLETKHEATCYQGKGLAVSADSTKIVFCDSDTISILDARSFVPLGTIPSVWPEGVAFNDDSIHILTWGRNVIEVWNVLTLRVVESYTGLSTPSATFAPRLNPLGPVILACSDRVVRVLDASTLVSPVGPNSGHTKKVTEIHFTPGDERSIVTLAENDFNVRYWDAKTFTEVECISTHGATSLALLKNGQDFVCAAGLSVSVWAVSQPKRPFDEDKLDPRCTLFDSTNALLSAISVSPEEDIVICGTRNNGKCVVWDMKTSYLKKEISVGTQDILSIHFVLNGTKILIAGERHGRPLLWVYDATSFEQTEEHQLENLAVALAVTPDRRTAWMGTEDKIEVRSVNSLGVVLSTLPPTDVTSYYNSITLIAFSPSGRHAVSCNRAGVSVRDVGGEHRLVEIIPPTTDVRVAAINSDACRVACAGDDCAVYVYKTALEAKDEKVRAQMMFVLGPRNIPPFRVTPGVVVEGVSCDDRTLKLLTGDKKQQDEAGDVEEQEE